MPTPPDRDRRILTALWAPYLDLLPGADESGPVYAERAKTFDLTGLPEPVRQTVRALVRLSSAGAMSDLTGVAWGDMIRPPERN